MDGATGPWSEFSPIAAAHANRNSGPTSNVLQQDARFENGFSSFHVVLHPSTADSFRGALTNDSRLTVHAMSERQFFADQPKVADRLRTMVLLVGIIVGI